jgi:hypothetical protein
VKGWFTKNVTEKNNRSPDDYRKAVGSKAKDRASLEVREAGILLYGAVCLYLSDSSRKTSSTCFNNISFSGKYKTYVEANT